MKIGIDLSYQFKGVRVTGVVQYAINVIKGLEMINKSEDLYLIVREEYIQDIRKLFPRIKLIVIQDNIILKFLKIFRKRVIQTLYIENFLIPKIAHQNKFDILFYTWHHFAIRPDLIEATTIVMFHDILHKHYPSNNVLYRKYMDSRLERIIQESHYILVSTNFVKNDILYNYPMIGKDKIKKIDLPVNVEDNKISKEKKTIKEPYIITVNSITKHKNIITLIKAFKKISKRVEHKLIIVGNGNTERLKEISKEYCLEDRIIFTGYISNEERNSLYKNAALFITASLHEGFGYTPVEAMILRVPVITSKETALPESTMNLAFYYEPGEDADALANQILFVLGDRPNKEKLDFISIKLREKYDLCKISSEYYELFTEIYQEKNPEGRNREIEEVIF